MNYKIKKAEHPNIYELYKNGQYQGSIMWGKLPTLYEFFEELKTNAHVNKMEVFS